MSAEQPGITWRKVPDVDERFAKALERIAAALEEIVQLAPSKRFDHLTASAEGATLRTAQASHAQNPAGTGE